MNGCAREVWNPKASNARTKNIDRKKALSLSIFMHFPSKAPPPSPLDQHLQGKCLKSNPVSSVTIRRTLDSKRVKKTSKRAGPLTCRCWIFVVLCEKSVVRARVDVLGIAKSWQAQGIRLFVAPPYGAALLHLLPATDPLHLPLVEVVTSATGLSRSPSTKSPKPGTSNAAKRGAWNLGRQRQSNKVGT